MPDTVRIAYPFDYDVVGRRKGKRRPGRETVREILTVEIPVVRQSDIEGTIFLDAAGSHDRPHELQRRPVVGGRIGMPLVDEDGRWLDPARWTRKLRQGEPVTTQLNEARSDQRLVQTFYPESGVVDVADMADIETSERSTLLPHVERAASMLIVVGSHMFSTRWEPQISTRSSYYGLQIDLVDAAWPECPLPGREDDSPAGYALAKHEAMTRAGLTEDIDFGRVVGPGGNLLYGMRHPDGEISVCRALMRCLNLVFPAEPRAVDRMVSKAFADPDLPESLDETCFEARRVLRRMKSEIEAGGPIEMDRPFAILERLHDELLRLDGRHFGNDRPFSRGELDFAAKAIRRWDEIDRRWTTTPVPDAEAEAALAGMSH